MAQQGAHRHAEWINACNSRYRHGTQMQEDSTDEDRTDVHQQPTWWNVVSMQSMHRTIQPPNMQDTHTGYAPTLVVATVLAAPCCSCPAADFAAPTDPSHCGLLLLAEAVAAVVPFPDTILQ
jgi:hypothetical protein